ncbi:MAG TPA: VOC family protein [Pseudonocardiaceae bacterium]
MTERDAHAPGTPCWIDLGSPDPDASAAFYGGLFGWEVPAEGEYRMCMLKNRPVAAIGRAEESGTPWWTTYFASADVAATAKAVTEAGGHVLSEPGAIPGIGSMAVLADPTGGPFSAWQAGGHAGSGLVDEHGTFTWAELSARDVSAAEAFYGAVFGWTAEVSDLPGGEGYRVFRCPDGSPAGGLSAMQADAPADLPDHWLVHFAVDDCDASVSRAVALGGRLSIPAAQLPGVGRFATLTGPHGEVFSILSGTQG